MEGQKWTQNRSPEPGVSDSWAAAQCVGGQCPTTLKGRLATAPRDQAEAQSVLQVEMVKSRGLLPGHAQGVQPQWKPEGTLVGMRFRKPNQIHMGISELSGTTLTGPGLRVQADLCVCYSGPLWPRNEK
uniref:Uncharacterized protein n=1 Tax=Myotis myotis TaxID=51298 RepID=A0A7J7UD51_MYOMY|nr:hypothetical protein mMyoMyo1_008754 [Myotis myotis]